MIEIIVLIIILKLKLSTLFAFSVSLVLLVFLLITYFFTNKIKILQQKWFATSTKNYKILSENLHSYELIRSFERVTWVIERYAKATDKFVGEVFNSVKPGIILGFFQGVLLSLLIGGSIFIILYSESEHSNIISLIVLINGLLLQIVSPLIQFTGSYRIFIQGISSTKQLLDVLSLPKSPIKLKHKKDNQLKGITVRNLSIKHNKKEVIKIDHLHIKQNGITLIIGKTGSGKSSLAKAIAGICNYTGEILTQFDVKRIYYIEQSVSIFDLPLKENVIMGCDFNKARYEKSLLDAGFSNSETMDLSKRNLGEHGINISGGQKQRVGIARASYHNASLIIYDEPTSSLDEITANQVISTIKKISQKKTFIIVTHDNKIKKIADEIIEL